MNLEKFVEALSLDQKKELKSILARPEKKKSRFTEVSETNFEELTRWCGAMVPTLTRMKIAKWFAHRALIFHPSIGFSDFTRGELQSISGVGKFYLNRIITHQKLKGPQFKHKV
jgi:hypothetical protein